MTPQNSETEFDALTRESKMARALDSFPTHLYAAWASSRTRLWVQPLRDTWCVTSRATRIRLLGVVALVAMATHAALVVLDARAVEPLAFVIPTMIAAISVLALILAEPLARFVDRWR
jgi:hypothetical protein